MSEWKWNTWDYVHCAQCGADLPQRPTCEPEHFCSITCAYTYGCNFRTLTDDEHLVRLAATNQKISDELANYNHFRAAVATAVSAELNAYEQFAKDGDDTSYRRASRETKRAQRNYGTASMSLGWCFARLLKAAGVEMAP